MIKKSYSCPQAEDFRLEDKICQSSMGTEDVTSSDPVDWVWENA